MSFNKVIQHFGKGGFDVITRGQVPPNPSELLMRDRMRQILGMGERPLRSGDC